VLDALADAGVRSWVGGGWGVAVLVGRQTRQHRDLDLAIDADQLQTCVDTLRRLATSPRPTISRYGLSWRPPVVAGWMCNPVTFDAEGHGRQAAHDGQFQYPPEAFTSGKLHGRRIQCLSVVQQQASILATSCRRRTTTTSPNCEISSRRRGHPHPPRLTRLSRCFGFAGLGSGGSTLGNRGWRRRPANSRLRG
jgi:lincosamide nucleotidyltransferase A/C/D/E